MTAVEERDYPGHVPTCPVSRQLAAHVLSRGEPVRVLAPEPESSGWPAGVELVSGDIAKPTETPAAFAGIDRMFLAGAVPETVRQAVSLACDGGVRHITVLSSCGPEIEIEFAPDSWYWLAIEVVVERSGAAWTHLRPAPLMAQTVRAGYPRDSSNWARSIRRNEVIREAFVDTAYPFVHEDDLAEVAMTAVFDDAYAGQVLTVFGDPISPREQLDQLGQALGHSLRWEELTPEQAADLDRRDGVCEEEIEHWLAVESQATVEPMTRDDTIERVLGRAPRSYADWLADHAEAFR